MLLGAAHLFVRRREAAVELAAIFGELTCDYRAAHLFHQAQYEAQVVYCRQPVCQQFLGAEQVMHIRCRVGAAGIAVASLFDGRVLSLVSPRGNVQPAFAHEHRTVARYARWQHAVEHVDAARHALHKVFRRAYAHQVSRRVLRQHRRSQAYGVVHRLLRLADAQPAYGVAGEAHACYELRRLAPQFREQAALHDTEQPLVGARVRLHAAQQPAIRLVNCRVNCLIVAVGGRAYI